MLTPPASHTPSFPEPGPWAASLGDDVGQAEHCSEVLKGLAHPLRLRIVALLCEGDAHVSALVERLGAEQPAVSQQLRILRMRGLVQVERDGPFARYSLAEPRLEQLVSCIVACSVDDPGCDGTNERGGS